MISLNHHFLKIHYSVSHLQLLMKFSLLLKKSPKKSCDLDPFPTLLKSCINQLIFPITTIINAERSWSTGFQTSSCKYSYQKQTLCKNYLKNYCPISNLGFLSKILEKVVANHLHEHIYNHKVSHDLQSAYNRFYSTETQDTQ